MIIQPNHSRVLTFFENMLARLRQWSFLYQSIVWYSKNKSSFRKPARANALKVNDKMGNLLK